jgi:hypothetical protein
MPLPLIPIILGVGALVTAGTGVAKGAKAISDNNQANDTNERARDMYNDAKNKLEIARKETGDSLTNFGKKKISCCQYTLKNFITLFRQVKNIEAASSAGIDELSKFKIDKQGVIHLEKLSVLATSMATGTVTGAIAGGAVAFGAYGAAGALATASTGTAIAGLSGAAATNATLAFFGGGSLAAGGLGIAGGTMVLGGLVAGPALLVLGVVMGAKASAKLDDAYSNLAQAKKVSAELGVLVAACEAIKARCDLFTRLLIKVDMLMNAMNAGLEEVLTTEGADYNTYTKASKEKVMALLATAQAFKALIDTPLLDDNGKLLEDSLTVAQAVQKQITQ